MRIANWKKFQHYKLRKPPWIRLYRELLEDPAWMNQTDAAKSLLCELWMVASDKEDGSLPAIETLAWRLRRSVSSVRRAVSEINAKFLEDASEMLAGCEQHATSETETETETEQSRAENAHAETVIEAATRLAAQNGHKPTPATERTGKPLDEIRCLGCNSAGHLTSQAPRNGHPAQFYCHKARGGCGFSTPAKYATDILAQMTPGARKVIEAMIPAEDRPYESPGMILTSELKFDEKGMLIQ